jgi:RNA ligase (TIGR02306 family)
MSTLLVPIIVIDKIYKHPKADALDIIKINGWQCVVKRGQFQVGESCIFIPPDAVLPDSLVKELQVENYLSSGNRVKVVRLRKEMSYGLLIKNKYNFPVGPDVSKELNITKYTPVKKFKSSKAGAASRHPLWVPYIDIEHGNNYSNTLSLLEENIYVYEKIHGTNSSIGFVDGELIVSSRNVNRHPPHKYIQPSLLKRILTLGFAKPKKLIDEDAKRNNWFWYPTTLLSVKKFIEENKNKYKQFFLYGEVFGAPVQSLTYGFNDLQYRCFDMYADGKWLDHDTVESICLEYNIPYVKCLYQGKYDLDKIKEIANSPSTISLIPQIKEGVVVKTKDRSVVLKFISDAYYELQYSKKPVSDNQE